MEETFGGCRSATTNEAHYTNASSTPQENLHCEIKRHNMKFNAARLNRCFSLLNQWPDSGRHDQEPPSSRAKPLSPVGN
ncbi:hypothetical protein DF043_18340 [Burkholderia cepacia]|nr:hypothetical protein DF043_18340 [Burkholderia cepacia]